MATLNAASRLREQVLKIPNTVLLISAGHPDRVIRFNRLPEIIQVYRKNKEQEKGFISEHTALNLDIGPDQECWRNAMRESSQMARRDRPMPEPLAVAPDTKTDWALGPEDVPVVEMNIIEVVQSHAHKDEIVATPR